MESLIFVDTDIFPIASEQHHDKGQQSPTFREWREVDIHQAPPCGQSNTPSKAIKQCQLSHLI
jgi:hypothetical protein